MSFLLCQKTPDKDLYMYQWYTTFHKNFDINKNIQKITKEKNKILQHFLLKKRILNFNFDLIKLSRWKNADSTQIFFFRKSLTQCPLRWHRRRSNSLSVLSWKPELTRFEKLEVCSLLELIKYDLICSYRAYLRFQTALLFLTRLSH